MRLVTLAAIAAAAAIAVASNDSFAQERDCAKASTCDELRACAPYKTEDPKYRQLVNCAAYGNTEGKKNTGNSDAAYGLPFQSRTKPR